MADADEDTIPRTQLSEDDDLEDETQDFRFLTQLTSSNTSTIPKRGTKDFEPNPTRSQASALDASRLAMHTALCAVRIHSGKNHVVGQYLLNEEDWRWEDDGNGGRNGRCVVVYKSKGTQSKVMGQADKHNWTWFLPEEALYLLERGSLDVRWPDEEKEEQQLGKADEEIEQESEQKQPTNDDEQIEGTQKDGQSEQQPSKDEEPKIGELPMSLQGAYASFIGKDSLTLERYSVYAALKRAGYIIQRAPTWHDTDASHANGHASNSQHPSTPSAPPSSSYVSPQLPPQSRPTTLIHRLLSWLITPHRGESCPTLGPIVAPGLYRSYTDIFRALALIPYHDSRPSSSSTTTPQTQTPRNNPKPPFRVHYHIWKPNAASTGNYRKTAPGPPDYRLCVLDARTTSMPSVTQIAELLDSQPDDSITKTDKGGARLEGRIKHGKRNVLLAVVDSGIVSYLRLSEAGFGSYKLFEEKAARGTKGGRGRGGGGRGGRGAKRGGGSRA